MTTPVSPNPISLNDVQTEFGGSNPIEIVEYYAGGIYVPVSVTGIPTSGQISLNDFYNKTKNIYQFTSATMSVNSGITFTSVISWTTNLPAGGYVTLYIVYPNSTSSTLSNLGTSSNSTVSFTQSTGVGTGTVYLFGYDSANTLLASRVLTYTVLQAPVINSVYFSPTPVVAGVTAFALYWSVSYATSIQYNILLPSGGRITDTITDLNSSSGQFITYTTGVMEGEVAAFANGGSVSRTITTTVVPGPTYTFTRSAASVDEGGSFTISFSTNQTGNFGYTITGVTSSDINNASLTGTVTNGSSIGYSVTPDGVADGFKTFTIALNNGLASTTVGINDTSTAPAPPTISGLTVSDTNPYPSSAITISWNTTNSVTSSTTLQIIFPSGGYYQFTNMAANSRAFGGYTFTEIGVHTVYVTVYSSSGQSASASTTFTVRSTAVIPTISASVSPASALNTSGVTISWSTTNTSSVAITIYFPGGSSTSSSGFNANGTYPIGPSSSLPTGSYSAVLTATSSTGNTATTTVYWTFTAAAAFSATLAGTSSSGEAGGSSITFNSSNNNLVINAGGTFNLDVNASLTYTTTGTGYLYCFLYLSTEQFWDFGYFYLDGVAIYDPNSTPAGFYKNAPGGYSGGGTGGFALNNYKVGPISAGSHTIRIRYTNDYAVNSGGVVSASWTWSAT